MTTAGMAASTAGTGGDAAGTSGSGTSSNPAGRSATATSGNGAGSGGMQPRAGAAGSSGGAAGATAGATASAGNSAAGSQSSAAGSGGAPASSSTAFHCPAGPFSAPLPSNVTPMRIAGFPPTDSFNMMGNTRTNIEGAVWIGDTLYASEFPFTPTPTARVLALGPGDKVSVAITNTGTNGMAVDAMGNLIATDHVHGALVRFSFPLGSAPQMLVGTYDGMRFNSPNDLAIRSDGNIYFSDPDYQAPSQHPQQQTRVYRLAPGAKEVTVIDATRSEPNGVTLSVDETKLFVAGSDGIFTYNVQQDGSVSAPGMRMNGFNGSADGLGIDCAGNLYAAAQNRVAVLSPAGMEIGSIPMNQAESVTNVAFGGSDHKTLFITSMGTGNQRGIWKAELNVPGFPY